MIEVEFEDTVYEFPDDVDDEQIYDYLRQQLPKPELQQKLDPGLYQDANNVIYEVTNEGTIQEWLDQQDNSNESQDP